MKHSADEIREVLVRLFRARGASEETAAVCADVLVEAELRGRTTHGLCRVEGILRFLSEAPPGAPRIVEERGPLVVIDGGDQSGYLVAAFAADQAARVASKEGHALVGARNCRHSGMLGYYAGRVAAADLVAFMTANCSPMVAPWGAAEPVFGTNPFAAAFPAKPWPVLIDMGTGAITSGALAEARRTGRPLPPASALDAAGRPTTDPAEVRAFLPFGERRGSAVGLLAQLLSGAMVGAAGIPENHRNYGLFLLAMKPDLFAPRTAYDAAVAQVVERIKSARPVSEATEVLVPGERSWRERERRLKEGIEVSDEDWRRLFRL